MVFSQPYPTWTTLPSYTTCFLASRITTAIFISHYQMHYHYIIIIAAASLVVSQSLESHRCGSSIQKRAGAFQTFLGAVNVTDGKLFNVMFDGTHYCDSNFLGPLWTKDNTIRDFHGYDYAAEMKAATGAQRAIMVEKNFASALEHTDNEK